MELGDGLHLDRQAFHLRRHDEPIDLEPQAFEVLAYLVAQRDRVVSKEELLDNVWGDRFVSESALTTRIKQVRRALGDDGVRQAMVRNVRGRGYQYVGPATPVRSATAPLTSTTAARLPRRRVEIIGRSADRDHLTELLGTQRLVTLLGIGGVGKTTLAVDVAHVVAERFTDGVVFVDLVPITDQMQLVTAIAEAAGLSGATEAAALDSLVDLLAGRDTLLVLDNCEHVLHDVTVVVDTILGRTASVRLLLTSREPLGLSDEQRAPLAPLPVQDDAGPAVELMAACAARLGIDLDDSAALGPVCARLDGLPLAIELADGQLRHLSIDALEARLDRRFDVLGGSRDDRHPSLGAVLRSTWDSMPATEQQLLMRLSAFPGSFSLDDLLAIGGPDEGGALEALGGLVDRSLVVRVARDQRYRIFETVRVYALEAAADAGLDPRGELADWCLDHVGTDLRDHCFDFENARWWREHVDAIRAAEKYLLDTRPADAALLAVAGGLATHVDEGNIAADNLARVATHLDRTTDPAGRAALHIAGTLAAMAARRPDALRQHGTGAEREARTAGDPTTLAIALVLASWARGTTDPAGALAMADEAQAVAEAAGDSRSANLAGGYRAWHLDQTGRRDEALDAAATVASRAPAGAGYDTDCALAAEATFTALHDPERALALYASQPTDGGFARMWANRVLLAAIEAADGNREAVASGVLGLHADLTRAGQSALPDVLVPVAALAVREGDSALAQRCVQAVRAWPTPTQSLQVTSLYRRLRDEVGDAADEATVRTAEEAAAVAEEAMVWLDR